MERLKLPVSAKNELRLILELFIQRKLRFFPENKRTIVNFEIVDRGDTYHLNVVSTIPQDMLPPPVDGVDKSGPV
jgi:hypothetical protein